MPCLLQTLTLADTLIGVQLQQLDGCAALGCTAEQFGIAECKVLSPDLRSWIEQKVELACCGIEGAKIGALMAIAAPAREREICGIG